MNHFIEIRTLTLKPNTCDQFHRLYIEEALPRLQRWNFDVVAHGPSLHDQNTYYVIRRYNSLTQRDEMEDAYYASDDWRKGPREAMLALIENYVDEAEGVLEKLVRGLAPGNGAGIDGAGLLERLAELGAGGHGGRGRGGRPPRQAA